MRASLATALPIAVLLSLGACFDAGSGSSTSNSSGGGGGGNSSSGGKSACLVGKTWDLVWVSSSTGSQSVGYWEFKTDGTYDWRCTKPTVEGGTGDYTYSDNILTVDGFLKSNLARSGKINLRFEGNQASFVDDSADIWVYQPPVSCFLLMQQGVRVKTGTWRFDLLPDNAADTSEMLVSGELTQDQELIRVDGQPQLEGILDKDRTWKVNVDPEFSFGGEFGESPAKRFRGTYSREGETGQILGYWIE